MTTLDPNSLRTLASQPPPRSRFLSANQAHARIQALETVLGLPHGEKLYNLGDFTARIRELEGTIVAKRISSARAAAAVAPPQTPVEQCLAKTCATGAMDLVMIGKMTNAERTEFSTKANGGLVRCKIEVAKLKNLLPPAVGATKKCLESKISNLEARIETESTASKP